MAGTRDEILANFQACTGIDDVNLAITHLEETDWDLMRAVNRAIPDETAARRNDDDSSPDIEMIEVIQKTNTNFIASNDNDQSTSNIRSPSALLPMAIMRAMASTSEENLRLKVEYEGRVHTIEIAPDSTVLDLKRQIETVCGVLACRQAITGWPISPRNDSMHLSTTCVTADSTLHLRDTTSDGQASDTAIDRLSQNFILNVEHEASGKKFSLPYPGTKSILEVKSDVYFLTDIPVRNQNWTGWPAVSDNVMLGLAGLDTPHHNLVVRAKDVTSTSQTSKNRRTDSDDSSVEEFEDATEHFTGDEDLFMPEPVSRKLKPLIPDHVEDETVGCLHFADEFASRYGPVHPELFPGTLEEAIKEACMKPARERRLLAIYLHHDRSVLANVFCTQLLCCDSVIQILAAYFVLWGWDLTFVENQQRFLTSFTSGLGTMAAMQVKSIPVEQQPVIIIVNRVRAGLEIMSIIQGNVGINELMSSLSETVDVFLSQQAVEIKEEDERAAREAIKLQQDAAFRESLAMDRAKEEARRHQEQQDHQERQKELLQREEEAAVREAQRQSVESRLPDEPPEDEGAIIKIRVREPKGGQLVRRFRETDSLQTLFDWLLVQGFPSTEYKILTSWPRRDLTSSDDTQCMLKQLGLYPQESLILEER